MGYVTLEDVQAIAVTEKAVLLRLADGGEKWVPKSVCMDGDIVEKGDFDIAVKTWWAEREDLA